MTPEPAAPASPLPRPSSEAPASPSSEALPSPSSEVLSGEDRRGEPPSGENGREESPWASADTRTEVVAAVGPAPGGSDHGPVHPSPTVTPTPARPRRSTVAVFVAPIVVVIVAIGAAWGVGRSGGPDVLGVAGPSAAVGTGNATRGADPVDTGVYQAPSNLCDQADFTKLRPTFDTLDGLTFRSNVTADLAVASCDGATGNETVSGTFLFQVQVSGDPNALAGVFEEDRSAAAAHARVTPVAGVGTEAYSYTEPGQVGVTVKVYDANMIMLLSWAPDKRGDPVPRGLSNTLIATCGSNLRLLRRP